VYDITKFARMHPGGHKLLLETAGTDQTKDFFGLHNARVLQKYARLRIGTLAGAGPSVLGKQLEPGFIGTIPYAEPAAFQGFHSPFYTASHHALKKACRAYFKINLLPEAEMHTRTEKVPSKAVYEKLGADGYLAAMAGPGKHLHDAGLVVHCACCRCCCLFV
jgi:hypothetical protein